MPDFESSETCCRHLLPSRCFGLISDPLSDLSAEEASHLAVCQPCQKYLLRVFAAYLQPNAGEMLARIAQLREHADFPAAFKALERLRRTGPTGEVRIRC